jgi:lysophospholipase L1-like esterase
MQNRVQAALIPALALLFAGLAFQLTADPTAKMHRKMFRPKKITVEGDWSGPAERHGESYSVESRVKMPRLAIPFAKPDAYRLRIFYVLEGGKPAQVRVSQKEVGQLKPGRGWKRGYINTPPVPTDTKPNVSFEIPEGGRLTIRRLDYRNYVFRIGSLLIIKPDGGNRGKTRGLDTFALIAGLMAIWATGDFFGRKWRKRRAFLGFSLLPVGVLSLGILIFQWATPYAFHVQPWFLAAVFLGMTALSTGYLFTAPVSRREALARVGLLAGSLAAAFLIAEVTVRVWDPPLSRPRVGSYMRHSTEYGWVNRAKEEGWHVDLLYHIRINRFGQRGPDYPMKKPAGVFRILGLGDSFTFGWGVAEEKIYLRLLERRLREAGNNVEVINAAVPAWHSLQSLEYLLREGVRFQPDLVVASFFVDDVRLMTLEQLLTGEIATEMRNEEAEVRRLRKNKAARSIRLYNLLTNYVKLRHAVRTYRKRNPYPTFESEREALPRNFDQDPANIAGLEKLFVQWVDARTRTGIPMLILFIPAGGSIHAPDYQGEVRLLRQVTKAKGFPFLDALSLFERHPAPRTLYLHPQDGHMSAAGHAVVGEALTKMVLEGGWLSRKGASVSASPGGKE